MTAFIFVFMKAQVNNLYNLTNAFLTAKWKTFNNQRKKKERRMDGTD